MAAWLWLYGPPGVGKSATGFAMFEHLTSRDERVAFIELDQIGMCMPAPDDARSRVKASNILRILENFEKADAAGVIVSGDVVEVMRHVLARAKTTPVLCRLRADDQVTIDRLATRNAMEYATPSSIYEAFNPPTADLDVSTHPLGVEEVAAEVLRRLGAWPRATATSEQRLDVPTPVDDAHTIVITGPRAVGTSTVAWQVLMSSIAAGHRTAYLDLDQLGFISAPLQSASLTTTLANVASCWDGFREEGSDRLVLSGHVHGTDLSAVRALLPCAQVVALTAKPETLLDRARRRSVVKDVWLPGDDLFGRDEAYLHEVVLGATSFEPDSANLTLRTDGVAPSDLASRIGSRWSSS